MRSWRFLTNVDDLDSYTFHRVHLPLYQVPMSTTSTGRRCSDPCGLCVNDILASALCTTREIVPSGYIPPSFLISLLAACKFTHQCCPYSFQDLLRDWQHRFGIQIFDYARPVPCQYVLPFQVAHLVVRGALPILHAAIINRRTPESNLLAHDMPDRHTLKLFVNSCAGVQTKGLPRGASIVIPPPQMRQLGGVFQTRSIQVSPYKNPFTPHSVASFLDFTQFLRDVGTSKEAFYSGLKAHWPNDAERLMKGDVVGKPQLCPGRKLLRRSRMRLHCASLLLQRAMFHDNCKTTMRFEVSLDASPAPNGIEFFGGYYNILGSDGSVFHTKFSMVSLGYGFCSLIDKAFCLMWMVYLLAGPSEATMRTWLSSVRISCMGYRVGIEDRICFEHRISFGNKLGRENWLALNRLVMIH